MDVWGWNRNSLAVLVTGLAASALIYTVYKLALPKPFPSFPYNKEAEFRLMGDVGEMKRAKYRRRWTWSQPRRHGSLISQLFILPFRRPTLVLTDYHEAVDILSRRTKDFDRSSRNKECIGFVAPTLHFNLKTRDPQFAYHKMLVRDLMTPKFLHEVSAPRVYENIVALVELWDAKSRKACGRPFPANRDLNLAILDIICSVAFSVEEERSSLLSEIRHLQSFDHDSSGSSDEPIEFSPGHVTPEVEGMLNASEVIGIFQASPYPWVSRALALLTPRHARAQWHRRAFVRRQVGRSLRKLAVTGPRGCESALDQLLWREMEAAQKTGREPNYYSPEIRDETVGYLLAGHDSLATATSWWVKYMSRYQSVQDRLRSELRQTHATAHQEGRWPTKDEICTTSIPYLDAVVEETLRCAAVVTIAIRNAVCDTQVLGHPIAKGTDIIICFSGPSLSEPALPASRTDESHGSDSKSSKYAIPHWGDDIGEYRPERWLKMDTDPSTGAAKEVFDANAGPTLAFGAGPRQCFGRRYAYMQLKMMMTILLWNFEFEAMSEALNSDEITEKMNNVPKQCYAKLKRL